ncbi:hypothetical protein [Streptomyces sp. TRM68367]|uniref:hypothetical protein n=1 Tax=Streptomyces sp. TRM68367 TaxID=2758415 RepID=UPI00165B0A88|nr:hypothetical protein [Streptomyces sp. TRM68367]MBC9724456.1 hypothetical protein [Streptomyces sp. TRM68367]
MTPGVRSARRTAYGVRGQARVGGDEMVGEDAGPLLLFGGPLLADEPTGAPIVLALAFSVTYRTGLSVLRA